MNCIMRSFADNKLLSSVYNIMQLTHTAGLRQGLPLGHTLVTICIVCKWLLSCPLLLQVLQGRPATNEMIIPSSNQ
jgi:hypothetical protein